ncbi:MAG: hypothetical protein ACLSHJ_07080 [Oscillospiraceae bacterium]
MRLANKCDGDLSHEAVFYHLLEEFYRDYLRELERFVIEGDMTGAVAGMVGSVYE